MPVTATGARATTVQSHHPEPTSGPAPAAKAAGASAAAPLEGPNRTPASAPYSEPPVLMTRADTSVGAEATKMMSATWESGAGGAGGASSAPPVAPKGPATGLALVGEEIDDAAQGRGCELVTTPLAARILVPVMGATAGTVAAGVVAYKVCNPPPRTEATERANTTGGDAEGASSVGR